MDKGRITYLFQRYLDGVITAEDLRELESALADPVMDAALKEALDVGYYRMPENPPGDLPGGVVKEKIFDHIISQPQRRGIMRLWPSIAAAAAVLLVALAGTWIFFGDAIFNRSSEIVNVEDIAPGGNRATLTLPNGRTTDLSKAQSGIIVGDGITYLDGTAVLEQGNKVKEQKRHSLESELTSYDLQLTTPKGGTYQVTLSDGSKVWLNAGSTLKYPSLFAASERVVEISGEGYFVVTKDKRRPFKIISSGQEIEVLGTEFNVSAYPDELETQTTLVKGSVQVTLSTGRRSSTVVLEPGQQSRVNGGTVNVRKVDILRYTAWKDGRFYFKNTPFEEMMRQISRWYDVEIIYTKQVPQETFTGEIRRNSSLMTVLELLNVSAVRIRLEGKKLIVD